MPELPDVEVYRRYLETTSLHQPIRRVEVESPGVLANTSPTGLARAIRKRAFEAADRHGKYLFAGLSDGGWLVFHFGMTGFLRYFQGEDPPGHTRCLISFDNDAHLAYVLPRKLGRIALADTRQDFIAEKQLGPDALAVDRDSFRQLAASHHGGVKAWLMNQSILAGIGNVYSDEILFQAGIHPLCKMEQLTPSHLDRLHNATTEVLSAAIDAEADPQKMPASFLLPRRRRGGRCPRCGGKVERLRAAGRSAWICPGCQQCPGA